MYPLFHLKVMVRNYLPKDFMKVLMKQQALGSLKDKVGDIQQEVSHDYRLTNEHLFDLRLREVKRMSLKNQIHHLGNDAEPRVRSLCPFNRLLSCYKHLKITIRTVIEIISSSKLLIIFDLGQVDKYILGDVYSSFINQLLMRNSCFLKACSHTSCVITN
jgi:hypothetical protein